MKLRFTLVATLGLLAAMLPSQAATVTVDLTATGTATLSNGAKLDATSAATTVGTGVIDSFVRVQGTGQQTSEQGYNTDANNVDDNKAGIFTHSITISDLDITSNPGYYTFLLDINQSGALPLLSLDDIQLYYASTGNLSAAGTPGPGATEVFDFQGATLAGTTCGGLAICAAGGAHNEILLNYSNNSGSGNGFDMFLLVPTSVLNGVSSSNFLYLYSSFGGVGGAYAINSGFEEWALIRATGQSGVPEPVSISLVGGGLLALGLFRKRFIA